jgi:hypothetical protein
MFSILNVTYIIKVAYFFIVDSSCIEGEKFNSFPIFIATVLQTQMVTASHLSVQ